RKWDATNDVDEFSKLISGRSPTSVGIVARDTFVVIDVDTADGGHAADGLSAVKELFGGELPNAPITQTPTKGLHLYMQPVRGLKKSVGALGAGIDVQAGNAVVLAPNSYRPDKSDSYRHLPNHGFYRPLAPWPDHVLFQAMFSSERNKLASFGIHSHRDLHGVKQNDWREHVDELYREALAAQKHERDILRAKRGAGLTPSQAKSVNEYAQNKVDNIAAQLEVLTRGGRNNELNKRAFMVGLLLGHEICGLTIDRVSVVQVLLDATECWNLDGRHPEERRLATINSGIDSGLQKSGIETSDWIERELDCCRGIHPHQAPEGAVGENICQKITLDQGRAELSEILDRFWDQALHAHNKCRLDDEPNGVAIKPWLNARLDTGIGKSHAVINFLAGKRSELKSINKPVIIYAPTRALCGEYARRLLGAGFASDEVHVYIGRSVNLADAIDPVYACPRHQAAKIVAASGRSVASEMCAECPLKNECEYLAQKKFQPLVWLIPANLAFLPSDIVPRDPFLRIFDEDFTGNLVNPAKRRRVELPVMDKIGKQLTNIDGTPRVSLKPDRDRLFSHELQMGLPKILLETGSIDLGATEKYKEYNAMLTAAISNCSGGYLTREALIDAGFDELDIDDEFEPRSLEYTAMTQSSLPDLNIRFKMSGEDDTDFIKKSYISDFSGIVRKRHSLWNEVYQLLKRNDKSKFETFYHEDGTFEEFQTAYADGPISPIGRVFCCAETGDVVIGRVLKINTKDIPTLTIDATPPCSEILESVSSIFSQSVADISVSTPNQHLSIITGTPTSRKQMESDQTIREICTSIEVDTLRHEDNFEKVLVITHMKYVEFIKKYLPESVTVKHYRSLRGIDAYKDFEVCYCVGAPLKSDDVVQAEFETFMGESGVGESGLKTRFIETRGGKLHALGTRGFENEVADSLYSGDVQNELLQCVGRLRGVSRTSDNPCRIVVLADVVLPNTEIDEVFMWQRWAAGPYDIMEAYGVFTESPAVLMRLLPRVFASEKIARNAIVISKATIEHFQSKSRCVNIRPCPIYNTYKGKGEGWRNWNLAEKHRVRVNTQSAYSDLYTYDIDGLKRLCPSIDIQSERHEKLDTLMDRVGFIPLNPAYCHQIAPDLFPTRHSARRPLKSMEQRENEITVEYQLRGARRKITQAIVCSGGVEDAMCRIREHLEIV
ncbi:MAG: bifunctional DNA primase/polymerase, partial [Hyphomicrobiales bacterium]